MKILVTGIAGDIGNGIGRILRESGMTSTLVGCDIHDQHIGQFVFDECKIVPSVNMPGYLGELGKITKESRLDAIVVTSEPELRLFLKYGISQKFEGIPLIMPNTEAMKIGFDKLATARFLAEQKLPFPWTVMVSENDPKEFPCILKSRFGAGGHDVRIVNDPKLIPAFRNIFPDFIWQECVGTPDKEYTCGIYRSKDGEIRTIIFLRRLNSGITIYGEIIENIEIDNLCATIANALNLVGSINVQLRVTNKGPMVFEINPRFSSTVVFRHKFGFEDVIWSINEKLFGTIPSYKRLYKVGTKFFRKFDELFL